MEWEVEYTDEFEEWWDSLDGDEQISVDASVGLLIKRGPSLPYPHSSEVRGSVTGKLRELRVQHRGQPYRILYIFDPRRVAVMLIGGNKTGDSRWYEKYVPLADRLYAEHMESLREENNGKTL
ncbi:MAG: addiction module toxin RelE [Desulfobacterales bacterium]|nr:addiction module toxin RelE [Desulfobacterales bacterium]